MVPPSQKSQIKKLYLTYKRKLHKTCRFFIFLLIKRTVLAFKKFKSSSDFLQQSCYFSLKMFVCHDLLLCNTNHLFRFERSRGTFADIPNLCISCITVTLITSSSFIPLNRGTNSTLDPHPWFPLCALDILDLFHCSLS